MPLCRFEDLSAIDLLSVFTGRTNPANGLFLRLLDLKTPVIKCGKHHYFDLEVHIMLCASDSRSWVILMVVIFALFAIRDQLYHIPLPQRSVMVVLIGTIILAALRCPF